MSWSDRWSARVESAAGMSLSDYLLAEIREVADRPTISELRERLESRERVNLPRPAAAVIREGRDVR